VAVVRFYVQPSERPAIDEHSDVELAVPTRPACWQCSLFQNFPRLRPRYVNLKARGSVAWMMKSRKAKVRCVLAVWCVGRMRNSHVWALHARTPVRARSLLRTAPRLLFLVLVDACCEQRGADPVLLGSIPERLRNIRDRFSSLEQLHGLCAVQICPSSFAMNRLAGLFLHFVASARNAGLSETLGDGTPGGEENLALLAAIPRQEVTRQRLPEKENLSGRLR